MTRYAVTGATGWLGRAAVAVLRERGEDIVAFASRRRDGLLALEELPDVQHDVLLHFAFVTRDHFADGSWESYVAANALITSTVREAVARHRPAVFYASSGAAAQPSGLWDNPYAELKRLDEHVLRDVSGGRCAVARVYNVAGPHVTKPGVFLLTDLVSHALRGEPLVLRSNYPVIRSYVDVEDLAAWAVAAAGIDICVGTAGELEVEAGDLAALVRDVAGSRAPIQRPPLDPALSADRYVGDPVSWRQSCEFMGLVPRDLRVQVQRTVEYLARAAESAAGRAGRR